MKMLNNTIAHILTCEEKLYACIEYAKHNPDWYLAIFIGILSFILGIIVNSNIKNIKGEKNGRKDEN